MVSETELAKLGSAPFQFFDLTAMSATEKLALKKRLKSELSLVVSAAESVESQLRILSCKILTTGDNCQVLSGNDCPLDRQSPSCDSKDHQASSCFKRKAADMYKQHIIDDDFPNGKEMTIMENSESASVVTGAQKCESMQRMSNEKTKDHKIDADKSKQCMLILNTLMNHEFGWIFNQPVDPVKLKIPDYFSIISKPMDLGTIRKKLKSRLYIGILDFAADVWLTFSNAMRYNPPGNDVHMMAKELNNIFSTKWNMLESKWRKERPQASKQLDVKKACNERSTSRVTIRKESAYGQISLAQKSLSSADRQILRRDLAKISKGKMPPQLICFLERFGFHGQSDGKVEVDIDEFDEEALLELHQLLRSCMNRLSESQVLKSSSEQGPVQDLCEGNVSGDVLSPWHNLEKPSMSSCTNGTCTNMHCRCTYHNNFVQSLSSDIDSERSSSGEDQKFPVVVPHLTHDDITAGDRKGGGLKHDSVATKHLHEENAQLSFPSTRPSTDKKGEERPTCEEQLSPSKALRAVILKTRFADTILKAQQKTLLDNGEKGDTAKMRQEREKLRRKQEEERARIEAQVKAAQSAAQRKAVEETKLQREREREAARLALQLMEKTVDIDENREILKDLEELGYSQPNQHIDLPDEMVVDFVDGFELQGGLENPLERLGLFIKKDDLDEEVEGWISASGNGDVEEGEIGLT